MSNSAANTDMKRCAATALAKAARDGLTPDLLFIVLLLFVFVSEVIRKILHEQSTEKAFIQLLTSNVSPHMM